MYNEHTRWATIGAALLGALAPRATAAQEARLDTAAAVQAAVQAARAWLALVDSGHYAESWDSAAQLFRAVVSKSDWEAAVVQARAPFEPFESRTLIGSRYATELPGAPSGLYVVLQFSTAVAGGRHVVETVTPMKDPDGVWRASGYFIRPQ